MPTGDVFVNYFPKKFNMRLCPEQIINQKRNCWPLIYNVLKLIICFRSHSGYILVCCSLDGTVACMEFTPDELGKPLTTEEKVSLNFIYWCRGVFRTQLNIPDGAFSKIVNVWKPLTILAKNFILDVWLGSKYGSVVCKPWHIH